MPKTAKKITLVVAAFVLVVFAVFLFNQTMQIVQSARSIAPTIERLKSGERTAE